MTPEEYINLLQLARIRESWTEELFKQYQQACIEMDPCIFNELRKILPEEEYKEFDLAYCEYIQPGQKGVVEYLEKLHRKETATERRQQSSGSKERKNF